MDRERSSSDFDARLFFKPNLSLTHGSTMSVTVYATANANCPTYPPPPPLLRFAWTLTVGFPWVDQGRDVTLASVVYSPGRLAAATSRVDTGLAFHRSTEACRRIDVTLTDGAPDYVELVRYAGNRPATATDLEDVPMQRGQSFNQHVRLFFKPRTSVTAGATVSVTVLATPNQACTDDRSAPRTLTVAWAMTMARPAEWVNQGMHSNAGRSPFYTQRNLVATSVSVRAGPVFHRSATTCRDIDLTLSGKYSSNYELIRYRGSSRAQNAALTNIHMEKDHADDGSARLFHRLNMRRRPAAGIITLTVVASANASCTNPAIPLPQTLAWEVTVRASWVGQDREVGWGREEHRNHDLFAVDPAQPDRIDRHRRGAAQELGSLQPRRRFPAGGLEPVAWSFFARVLRALQIPKLGQRPHRRPERQLPGRLDGSRQRRRPSCARLFQAEHHDCRRQPRS